MLIDTHCHINMMIKKNFDVPLNNEELSHASIIIEQAQANNVSHIINVGTSAIESLNCVRLAQQYHSCYAAIGIHPNDCTHNWRSDINEIKNMLRSTAKDKIIAIGECGFDKHYPDFNISRQKDAFKAHVEIALEHNLPLIIHTRQAADETLYALDEFSKENLRGIIHCFSEDQSFADEVIKKKFMLGIGGTITYPANDTLRAVVKTIELTKIVLETDAPFLPIQAMRGKKNHPQYIKHIAEYIAQLRNEPFESIAHQTTTNANILFGISC